jgi:hypothetical protein
MLVQRTRVWIVKEYYNSGNKLSSTYTCVDSESVRKLLPFPLSSTYTCVDSENCKVHRDLQDF